MIDVNQSTTSVAYVVTGISVTCTLENIAHKFRITCSCFTGASASGTVPQFRVYRDAVDITPVGTTALASVQCVYTTSLYPISFLIEDAPGDLSSHTYEIRWKTSASTAYLGRDGGATYDVPNVMTLEEVSP